MEQVQRARNVGILIYENVEPLDFVGPFEVFISSSNRGKDFFVYTVAETNNPVNALGNLSINPAFTIETCPKPDILVVPGGWGSRKEMHNKTITNWIQQSTNHVEILLSVCTGALILANTNLLNGLKVTTNQSAINELRDLLPASAEIVENVRYIDNGKVILSTGVSAGMDASLYVVRKLLGEERAIKAANIMEYDWKYS